MVRYLFYTIGDLTYQSPLVDVKDGMHFNIPWPRLPSHLGHGILQCIPSLTSITEFIPSQLTTKTSGCYYSL